MSKPSPTKEKFSRILKALLTEKPLNRITIQEIVNLSGMRRQSFYYHFDDLYSLLVYVYRNEISNILAGSEADEDWRVVARRMLMYVKDNQKLCENVLMSLPSTSFRSYIFTDFHILYYKIFESELKGTNVKPEYISFLADFFVNGSVGYVLQWIENGLETPIDQILDWYAGFMMSNIYVARMKPEQIPNFHDNFKDIDIEFGKPLEPY